MALMMICPEIMRSNGLDDSGVRASRLVVQWITSVLVRTGAITQLESRDRFS
jgi:hypothetical protein